MLSIGCLLGVIWLLNDITRYTNKFIVLAIVSQLCWNDNANVKDIRLVYHRIVHSSLNSNPCRPASASMLI